MFVAPNVFARPDQRQDGILCKSPSRCGRVPTAIPLEKIPVLLRQVVDGRVDLRAFPGQVVRVPCTEQPPTTGLGFIEHPIPPGIGRSVGYAVLNYMSIDTGP